MAITNQERVGKALELLKAGLAPFVEREVKSAMKNGQSVPAVQAMAEDPIVRDKPITQWDSALLLKLIWDGWNDVFRKTLGPLSAASSVKSVAIGIAGRIRTHFPVMMPTGRWIRCAASDGRFGLAGRRSRQDENGTASADLRRTDAE